MSSLTRVGVLRGGPGPEYMLSFNSGLAIINALRDHYSETYEPRDILIDHEGNWHIDDVAILPHELHSQVDVIFNALRGPYGEDGRIQSIFETYGIPFTGSSSLGSALSLNKSLAKNLFKQNGLKSPFFKEISSEEICLRPDKLTKELFQTLLLPAIVKPNNAGSSVAVSLVRNYSELPEALKEAALHGDKVLIEEYLVGNEASCAVIDDFRGQEYYVLPPIEIRSKKGFFGHHEKQQGQNEHLIPASFPLKVKNELAGLATKVHQLFGLRHYSKSDFIIHPRRGIYILEIDSLPSLTEDSLIPQALTAVGSNLQELVGHVLGMAMSKGR
ncbi:MAG: ATP-grasp domain-containing protein [Candidatus Paceibacterota bacterium]|jgi:D-alanine-D-alanine ligase